MLVEPQKESNLCFINQSADEMYAKWLICQLLHLISFKKHFAFYIPITASPRNELSASRLEIITPDWESRLNSSFLKWYVRGTLQGVREFRFRQLTMIYGTAEQYKRLIVQLRNDLLVTEPRHATEEPVIADLFLRSGKKQTVPRRSALVLPHVRQWGGLLLLGCWE